MIHSKFTLVPALLGAAAVLTFIPTTLRAQVCNVPTGSYPTIQSAASDPTCTEIKVAPGVYNERVVVAHPNTTINGAQEGNRFDDRSPDGESIVDGSGPTGGAVFAINAADVTIDGFTIRNSVTTLAAHGISVSGAGNDAAILNNIFDTITTMDPSIGGNGSAQAVYLTSGGPDNVSIQDNEMRNIQGNGSTKGVLLGDNGGLNASQNVLVKRNFMHDITSTRGAYGVLVANVPNVTGLNVTDNLITGLTGSWAHAIGLEGDTPGAKVLNNDISNLTDVNPTPVNDAVAVFFQNNPSLGTAEVHNNNFNLPATHFGIALHPSQTGGPVDGTCNWWNSPSGPTAAGNPGGTGAQAGPGVSYSPWLIAPAPGGSCFGGNVPTNKDQCKSGGWMTMTRPDGSTFKNQGDCIQFVNTGN